jgi:hypothetical protein
MKIKLEIAVNEALVERTIQAITEGTLFAQIGDGTIWVVDLPKCVRAGERHGDTIGRLNSPLSKQSHQFCAHPGQTRPRRTRRGLAFAAAEPAWKGLQSPEAPGCPPDRPKPTRGAAEYALYRGRTRKATKMYPSSEESTQT